jgi:hypothetical protein
MVYQESIRFLDHGLSFWKKLRYFGKNSEFPNKKKQKKKFKKKKFQSLISKKGKGGPLPFFEIIFGN